MMPASLGIKHNLSQFLHQLFQVLLVGLTIGTMRTVVPTLAETEFGVPQTSFLLLSSFVVAFGFVKGFMNFYAGRWSETIGRKPVLILGWLVGLPIPILIWFAPSWSWIVGATILLGVNQGLTWSMTQTAKLDFTLPRERGLTLGLNEFSGYIGVALGGILTAWLTETIGLKIGLLWFGLSVVGMGLFFTVFFIQETRPRDQYRLLRNRLGEWLGVTSRLNHRTRRCDLPGPFSSLSAGATSGCLHSVRRVWLRNLSTL